MTLMRTTIVAALLFAVPALAQAPSQDHDQHHPGTPPAAQTQPAQPAPPTARPAQPQPGVGGGMMGGGMMGGGMMGGGMMGSGGPQGGQGMMGPGMMQGMMGQAGQGMMGQGMACPMMAGTMGSGTTAGVMIDRIDGRLAFLKTELKITEAQLPAWNTFATAVRSNVTTMKAELQAMHGMVGGDVSAPDRLLAQANAFAAHAEEMTKLKAALDPLYAALSAEQKKIADEIVLSPMGVPVGMM